MNKPGQSVPPPAGVTRPPPSRRRLAAGFVLASVAASLASHTLIPLLFRTETGEEPSLGAWMGRAIMGGGLSGFLLGAAQAWILRRHLRALLRPAAGTDLSPAAQREIRNAFWWLVATVGGSAIGNLPFTLLWWVLGGMGTGALSGGSWVSFASFLAVPAAHYAVLGVAQWLVLRHRAHRAESWILATIGGGVAGGILSGVVQWTFFWGLGRPDAFMLRGLLECLPALALGTAQAMCLTRLEPKWPPDIAEALEPQPEPDSAIGSYDKRLWLGAGAFAMLNVAAFFVASASTSSRSAGPIFGLFSGLSALAVPGLLVAKASALKRRATWVTVLLLALLFSASAFVNFFIWALSSIVC